MSRTLDEIRPNYGFDPTCSGSVPESIICFLESENIEDAIRNAVSLGGDADTMACIAGSIAGAYYGEFSRDFYDKIRTIIPKEFLDILSHFLWANNDIAKTFCEIPNVDRQTVMDQIF